MSTETVTPSPSPAPSPAPAPAAPTTPAPSSPTPPAERPTSFNEALAREESAAEAASATPETTTPEAQPPTLAIVEPPPGQVAPGETQGPIPFDRHKAALENARTKATTEAEQRFHQTYSGPLQVVQALRQDLPGTLGKLLDEAVSDPSHGPAVRAMLGQKLNGLRQRAPGPQAPPPSAAPDQEPSLFVEVNGERYFDPDAMPKWQDWNRRQTEQALTAKFDPLMRLQQQVQQAEAVAQYQLQSQQTVAERMQHWKDQPGFQANKKAIAVKQQELYDKGLDEWTALGLAYAQVVPPLLQQQNSNTLTAQAVAKAAGRTDNPGASAPSPPRRPTSFKEALDQQGLVDR